MGAGFESLSIRDIAQALARGIEYHDRTRRLADLQREALATISSIASDYTAGSASALERIRVLANTALSGKGGE